MALAAGLLAGCSPRQQPTIAPTSVPTTRPQPTAAPTAAPQPALSAYWPTDGWRASTPEQQGIDSAALVRLLQFAVDESLDLHSLLIIRNGYAVLEAYFHPFQQATKDALACVTRSFISALMGIAIGQGYIEGTDQKMLDFFPDLSLADDDPRKEDITLAHLLTRTSGLQAGNAEEENRVQQILDASLRADPGTSFGFGGDTYLLSAILQASVGTDVLSFAREHLFGPLGISDVSWDSDVNGIYIPTGMQLTPCDMAKLGYLYLNDGDWEGEQVVPAEWVAASLERYSSTGCGLGFGYHWWIYAFGAYAARSYIAQCCVVPDTDLVVALTNGSGISAATAAGLVEYFIVPAAQSSEPLPENPEAVAQLESLIEQVGRPPES
jgi:CubicO group peptidase (beta-lactamase class C family)